MIATQQSTKQEWLQIPLTIFECGSSSILFDYLIRVCVSQFLRAVRESAKAATLVQRLRNTHMLGVRVGARIHVQPPQHYCFRYIILAAHQRTSTTTAKQSSRGVAVVVVVVDAVVFPSEPYSSFANMLPARLHTRELCVYVPQSISTAL